MPKGIDYARLVDAALRGVVRSALADAAANGLGGGQHFYIIFDSSAEGVVLAPELARKHGSDFTIVLQNQFWDLSVDAASFSVTLTFGGRAERITVPFAAIRAFVDPSTGFSLDFMSMQDRPSAAAMSGDKAVAAPIAAARDGNVVSLDAFRNRK